MNLTILTGDIVDCQVDAIVNAANPTLLGGGGVDGAIHRAAGRGLRQWILENVPEALPGMRCRVGKAVASPGAGLPGSRLKATHIIHTVGPIFPGGGGGRPGKPLLGHEAAAQELRGSILAVLRVAEGLGVKTLAFPAISCGVFGGSIEVFAKQMALALGGRDWPFDEVQVVLFSDADRGAFEAALA
jgi:O-acetyl-ADP-ribose deacetylase (regulator of RNase III)